MKDRMVLIEFRNFSISLLMPYVILQNPSPKYDDLENIFREDLGFEDVEVCEDMLQEDPFDTPIERTVNTPRESLQDYVKKITELKNHELVHDILPENDKEEHLKLLQELKDLSIKCFDFCSDKLPTSPVHDDEPIPSTSGSNNIVNTNTTFDDDEDFGTENRDYLHSEINVELIDSIESSVSSDILPDLEDLK